jgi:hypothetical protein
MNEGTHAMNHALRAIEDPPVPEAVWTRLDARRRTVFARRRQLAGAALLALVAGGLTALLPRPGADVRPDDRIVEAGAAGLPEPIVLQVRAIDRELQAAYQSGADAGEIARLWRARVALLDAGGDGTAVDAMRI